MTTSEIDSYCWWEPCSALLSAPVFRYDGLEFCSRKCRERYIAKVKE